MVAREYLEEAAVVFIVEVVFIIVVISLTSSRTGGPVREAQRWLPPCQAERYTVFCYL